MMIQGSTQDYFNQNELIQIYEKAGEATLQAMKKAATELYPERMSAPEAPFIQVETGIHGRWFILDPDQPAQQPVYTIKSGHCSWIGVLEDGRALPY